LGTISPKAMIIMVCSVMNTSIAVGVTRTCVA